MNRAIAVCGAVLAVVALGAVWVAASRSRDLNRERADRASRDLQIASLREEVRQLGRRTAPSEQLPPGSFPPDAQPTPDGVAELRREVETLRSLLQSALARLAEEQQKAPRSERDRPRVEDAAALQARALDATRPAAERIDALSRLRMMPGGRTDAVAVSMLDLLESGVDARARADILRHVKGAVAAGQAPRVIAILRSDPERIVREEAAETLGPLRGAAEVRAALEEAARSDASEQVRREARRALERD